MSWDRSVFVLLLEDTKVSHQCTVVEFFGLVFAAEREPAPLRPVTKLEQGVLKVARGEVVI